MRAGGGRVYKVYKRIECLDEINDFLETTQKFSKKFYNVKTLHGDADQAWLSVNAIGISRDLTYIISWQPRATPMPDHADPTDVYLGDAPVKGWIPKKEDELGKLYPNYGNVPDRTGEHHWITLFTAHGFVRVDNFEEM